MPRVYERYPKAHFVNQAKKDNFEYDGVHNGDCEVAQNAELNDATIDITGNVYIEEGVHFGHEVMILSCSHPTDELDGMVRRRKLICKSVTIKKNAYIGSRALILPGVTVGEGAYVAAGAVVVKDVEPFTLVAGFPAKKVRKLKVQGKTEVKKEDKKPEQKDEVDNRELGEDLKNMDTTPKIEVNTDPALEGAEQTVQQTVKVTDNGETEVLSSEAVDSVNEQLKQPDAGKLPDAPKKRDLPPAGPDNYKDSYANRKARGELTPEELKKEERDRR